MGILNMTPDSFFEKSRKTFGAELMEVVQNMVNEGMDILDVGASSTRPGAQPPSASEELGRLQEVIPFLRKAFPDLLLSIDTFHSEVASFALNEGFDLVNDISGGQFDDQLLETVATHKAAYVLTYHRGSKANSSESHVKDHLMMDALRYFSEKITLLEQKGILNVILDPGFGFGKSLEENYELIRSFDLLHVFEKPILIGVSRKTMIREVLAVDTENALNGTSVLHTLLYAKNAHVFRVHDVKEMNEVRALMKASL
ncbi:MAG: dihydropteroate synthase [Crocinitomicaceae bacterium]|nr:dihydropteroate synthase [Crocinitomicaceae bacterium]MDP4760718.1 dihydropteroate synthase [Crocinitomicaceae bacterium]